jgi:hypothetical protein
LEIAIGNKCEVFGIRTRCKRGAVYYCMSCVGHQGQVNTTCSVTQYTLMCLVAEVVEAANFKDGKFEETISGELLERGYWVGRKVVLIRRLSVDVGKKGPRYDINVGDCGFIRGVVSDKIVVKFSRKIKDELREFDVAVKTANMSFDIEKHAKAPGASTAQAVLGAAKGSGKALGKAFAFLKVKGQEADTVDILKWQHMQARSSDEMTVKLIHSALGCSLKAVIDALPKFNETDLAIVKRNNDIYEIWTLKEFAPHKLVFAPESNEWKDRNWCFGKSALVKYDTTSRYIHTVRIVCTVCCVPDLEGIWFAAVDACAYKSGSEPDHACAQLRSWQNAAMTYHQCCRKWSQKR